MHHLWYDVDKSSGLCYRCIIWIVLQMHHLWHVVDTHLWHVVDVPSSGLCWRCIIFNFSSVTLFTILIWKQNLHLFVKHSNFSVNRFTILKILWLVLSYESILFCWDKEENCMEIHKMRLKKRSNICDINITKSRYKSI